jgi:hypothetical protein
MIDRRVYRKSGKISRSASKETPPGRRNTGGRCADPKRWIQGRPGSLRLYNRLDLPFKSSTTWKKAVVEGRPINWPTERPTVPLRRMIAWAAGWEGKRMATLESPQVTVSLTWVLLSNKR